MRRILPEYLAQAILKHAQDGEDLTDCLCRLFGEPRRLKGTHPRKHAFPQLYRLAIGEACVLPWRPAPAPHVIADQSPLRMAVSRCAKSQGWILRSEGNPAGLRVTRKA